MFFGRRRPKTMAEIFSQTDCIVQQRINCKGRINPRRGTLAQQLDCGVPMLTQLASRQKRGIATHSSQSAKPISEKACCTIKPWRMLSGQSLPRHELS